MACVVRDTEFVTRRSLSDPASMVGATPEEVLALRPAGWLVRPFPGGHPGFRMMSPGRMPGSAGTISVHGATPGFRYFTTRPQPRVFILNCVLEHPLLVEVLSSWSTSFGGSDVSVSEIPHLARATENLVRDGLITVYEDPLVGAELTLVPQARAVLVVTDPLNWWRDEDDETVPAATSVFALDITGLGRRHLTAVRDKPRGRWLRRRA